MNVKSHSQGWLYLVLPNFLTWQCGPNETDVQTIFSPAAAPLKPLFVSSLRLVGASLFQLLAIGISGKLFSFSEL